MINRTDWQAVRDALIADDRAKLGEPPTVDELLAYERGELSKEDAERVQQLLVAYPELARAYAAPFPSDDDGDLPGAVIDRQWNAFRAANGGRSGARVLQFWRGLTAIAATVAIGFGAMLWHAHEEQLTPRILPAPSGELTPDGRRGLPGQAQSTIRPSGGSVLIDVSLPGPIDYETYRLELAGSDPHKVIWSSEPLRMTRSQSFYVDVPSRLVPDGTYQLIAYGLRGNAQEPVATYTFDVRRAPAADP
jgi:hypothetical protein